MPNYINPKEIEIFVDCLLLIKKSEPIDLKTIQEIMDVKYMPLYRYFKRYADEGYLNVSFKDRYASGAKVHQYKLSNKLITQLKQIRSKIDHILSDA